VNAVRYTTGKMFPDGGWFASLRVQIRRRGTWVDVAAPKVDPPYPMTNAAGDFRGYEFTFDELDADGVRVVGAPGGARTFTSAAEIAAYYR
jgi:hypothetical protein